MSNTLPYLLSYTLPDAPRSEYEAEYKHLPRAISKALDIIAIGGTADIFYEGEPPAPDADLIAKYPDLFSRTHRAA